MIPARFRENSSSHKYECACGEDRQTKVCLACSEAMCEDCSKGHECSKVDARDLSDHLEALQRFGGKMPQGDVYGKKTPGDLIRA